MFRNIDFRYTDAQEEMAYAPEIIARGFVDINKILEQINRPEKYLVIGPKGAGKSALSSKLQLNSAGEWDLFVSADELEKFDFNLLEKTGGERGGIGGPVSVWQMLLFLRLMPIFLKDESVLKTDRLVKFNDTLQKYGLTSSEGLIKIVQYTSRRGIFSNFKTVFAELRGEKTEESQYKIKDPAAIADAIKLVFRTLSGANSRYFLIIDGLDYAVRNGKNSSVHISDLIDAVRLVNSFFNEINIRAKVIILIRDEIFSHLPHANLAKRENDNGLTLKWYEDVRSPFETELLRVIENRARIAGMSEPIKVLWRNWFDEKIDGTDSMMFILNNTRHLPRDLISFFRELQKISKTPPFSRSNVLSALSNYSDWFLQEMSDSLVGLVDDELRISIPSILSSLGRTFTFDEFSSAISSYDPNGKRDAYVISVELFNTSWIGNVWKTDQGTDRFSWKHRKRHASFNKNQDMRVHTGLWKTLNLI